MDWVRSVEPEDEAEKQALNLYAPHLLKKPQRSLCSILDSCRVALDGNKAGCLPAPAFQLILQKSREGYTGEVTHAVRCRDLGATGSSPR